MKTLVIAVMIIAIPLIAALFVKRTFTVEREVIIHTSTQEVFNYLRYLNNHENFSKWLTLDPNRKKDY